jgi:hypothetical protein
MKTVLQTKKSPILAFLASLTGLVAACVAATDRVETPPSPPIVIKNQGFLPFAGAPINYRSADLNDPIARLEKRLERGEQILRYDPQGGYLRSVLEALEVPVSSQTLVFSKTSFQFPQITPATPRALYYNDDIYVGHVHNSKFLEFASFDARQGAIFYVMDAQRSAHPRFERAAVDCVQCHVASSTRGIPGVLLKSVYTRPTGYPAAGTKSFITGQESPLSERWGGWYVTATRGAEGGLGNLIVSGSQDAEHLDKPAGNLTSVSANLTPGAYLSGSSDIVALMVLAHQTQMHNLITQTNYETRLALFAEQERIETGEDPVSTLSDTARNRIEGPAERLVRYLLFTNETRLDGEIAGNTNFAEEFAARGPFDSEGRSLRQFDLHTRIFKYPCSYLIYSDAFDAIPSPAKEYIYRRLFEVLSGGDQSVEFSRLSKDDRRAILEILVETKPGVPEEWKQFVRATKHSSTDRAATGAVNRQP